jgi:hypothetical protein
MADRALVIGIDNYANPDWKLRAAVRDAVAFAKWVTEPGAGRATPETLTLLLAPEPARPVTDLPYLPADSTTIMKALVALEGGGAVGADRLWVFYAGHGLAPSGSGPDEAPLIVPCDTEDIDLLRRFPIDLHATMRKMQVRPPKLQFWFVDACRGIVDSEDLVATQTAFFFDLKNAAATSLQAAHFATTAGKLANETGLHGLFGGALAAGLAGQGPKLRPAAATGDFELTLSALTDFTRKAMKEKAVELNRRPEELPTQEPWLTMSGDLGGEVLARFPEVPRIPLRILVDPAVPLPAGSAWIKVYDGLDRTWLHKQTREIALPLSWTLPADDHLIEVSAAGFEPWQDTISLIAEKEVEARLRPVWGLESSAYLTPESTALDTHEGVLSVETHDQYAAIALFDDTGAAVDTGTWSLDGTYPIGRYRVEVALPSERKLIRMVSVTHEEPTRLDIRPDPALTRLLPPGAGALSPHEGFTAPSEVFGAASTSHLGSILAWAASAAQYPPGYAGEKLRSLGIARAAGGAGDCFVRVLVGDTRVPSSYSDRQGVIESLSLSLGGDERASVPVPGLDGYAVQWTGAFAWDSSLIVSADGLSPKRFPLPHVPGHVWTLVIARETTQRIEIHRYLAPLDPVTPFDDTIRLVEHSWRAFDAREPLAEGEAERLLSRALDPLALAVLGYRLLREERMDQLAEVLQRLDGSMIADRLVLTAALSDRDAKMTEALTVGSVPVVGEGYRALEAWVSERFAAENAPPPRTPEPLTPGLWTSFDPTGAPVVSQAFPVHDAPGWAAPLLPAARATARIDAPNGRCTGFLVAPDRVLSFPLGHWSGAVEPVDYWAQFDNERLRMNTIRLIREGELTAILARLERAAEALPLVTRVELPAVGSRIAVIGYPVIDFNPTPVTLAAFSSYPAGEKMIMPGLIVEATPTRITYECWTMKGTAGGPIIDLATGEVIGMHLGGRYLGGTRKLGWGAPLSALSDGLGPWPP